MDQTLTDLEQVIDQSREVLSQLDKSVIMGPETDSTNLFGQQGLIEDLIDWSRWLARKDRPTISRIFTGDELESLKNNFKQSADLLLTIQNDRQNDNRSGRVFIDRDSLVRDLLVRHSQLMAIGRARIDGRTLLTEVREIADSAQQILDDTKKLVSLKAIGTLAEYFEELVAPDIEKPKRSSHNPCKSVWYAETWKGIAYRRKKFGNPGYQARARRWFWLSVIVSILTSIYAYVIVFVTDKINTGDAASVIYAQVTLKILALAVPILLIRFCLRNYGAYSHLATVNRHKSAILKTFRAIKEDSDADTQKKVLIQMVKLIADPGETGLISRNEGAGDGSINITTPILRSR